jgi:hypothetical protein
MIQGKGMQVAASPGTLQQLVQQLPEAQAAAVAVFESKGRAGGANLSQTDRKTHNLKYHSFKFDGIATCVADEKKCPYPSWTWQWNEGWRGSA